jgi:hypothetical protein
MNTLTMKINDLDLNFSQEQSGLVDGHSEGTGMYEVIENEVLRSSHFNDLVISGSLFSLTTFIEVSFESCTFFASKIENCTFINCKFENCTFEFSSIEHTKFNRCSFENTLWDMTFLKKAAFSFCSLDANTNFFLGKEENAAYECQSPQELSWEEVLAPAATPTSQEVLPPIPSEEDGETAILHIDRLRDALTSFLKVA